MPSSVPNAVSPQVNLKPKVPTLRMKLHGVLLAILLTLSTLVGCPNSAWALNTAAPIVATANTSIDAPISTPVESQMGQTNTSEIADDKVEQFSQAYIQVLQLLSDRAPDLSATKTADEAASIQQAIESEAVALIQESGLTLTEYMQILEFASQDETVRDQVFGKINESTQK